METPDFPRCPGHSPACLGMVEFDCCGTQGLVERLDKEIENEEKAAAAERKRKNLSLPKSSKKLALSSGPSRPRLASTPQLMLKCKKLPRRVSRAARKVWRLHFFNDSCKWVVQTDYTDWSLRYELLLYSIVFVWLWIDEDNWAISWEVIPQLGKLYPT